MRKLQAIEAVTRAECNGVLLAVREAIQASGGFITDRHLYSNLSATIVFELPGAHLPALADGLTAVGLSIKRLPEDGERMPNCALSITFVHDDPDMRRDVPAFG